MDQLFQAQNNLKEYNDKISLLLGQIDIIKEAEEQQQEILKSNEALTGEIDELRFKLSQKEKEINSVRQQQELTAEMKSGLESAYLEFNGLQEKFRNWKTRYPVPAN
ncbi:MAG: hypothetical protein IPG86_10150 [Chitinophagaceae bacterium]|nr:hypothetical protein [Chitinophagaceae bacterium]